MFLRQVFDPCLAQYAYLIACQATGEAIVIDPERDVDRYLALAEEQGFRIIAAAETHIHADFLSGARELAHRVGARLYLSAEGESSGWGSNWAKKGEYDVVFLKEGETFKIGNIAFTVMKTPGHTPEHLAYRVTDAGASGPLGLLTGDFIFVGDVGRPDLLETAAKIAHTREASAHALYESGKRVMEEEGIDDLLVWPAHGAGSSCGKGLGAVPHSTIGYEKRNSPSLGKIREGKEAFVRYILEGQPEPPFYFARMKTMNRDGVPLLDALPDPRRLSAQELGAEMKEGKLLPIDTRDDRGEFFRRHLPGALLAPFSTSFCTVVGSLVDKETTPLLLVVAPEHQEEAIRRLVRIGYDQISAVVTPDTLGRYFESGGASHSLPVIDFAQAETLRGQGTTMVDVRYSNEYESGHLPGAIHAPYTRLVEKSSTIPKDKPIAVHCLSGFRASVASAYLSRQGYQVSVINDYFKPI